MTRTHVAHILLTFIGRPIPALRARCSIEEDDIVTLNMILRQKPAGFIAVSQDTTIREVLEILSKKRIGAVLVMGDQSELAGILSERDIVRGFACHAVGILDMAAAELMTPDPVIATPATTIAKAMEMMTDGHFRHLPIVDSRVLIGLVSIGDVVKARIDQHMYEFETLRTYVAGGV
jgi:CBS domain-containing protein